MTYLDTHVVAWLFAGRPDLLPPAVRRRIERDDLVVSPMVVLELQYLFETKRTTEPADVVIRELQTAVDLRLCDLPFHRVAETAVAQSWTRDPFDRIITSHAVLRRAPLASKDATIRANYARVVWD
jgi:PIN domain nuclease of toxin-antitoxin system